MKTLLLAVPILFIVSMGYCGGAVWKSSFTVTADTTKSLCGLNVSRRCLFHGVRVGHGTSGNIALYNTQGAASSQFALIFTSAAIVQGGIDYDVLLTSGCTYTTSAANQATTLLYECQ